MTGPVQIFGSLDTSGAGEPVDIAKTYAANETFLVNLPNVAGPFIDVNGADLEPGTEQLFTKPGGGLPGIADAANVLPSEVLLLNVVDGAAQASERNEFENVFKINDESMYFKPKYTGRHRITELLIRTNHELFTVVSDTRNAAQKYSSSGTRLKTGTNNGNTAFIASLAAGIWYEIDPQAGGGTSVGYHSVKITYEP